MDAIITVNQDQRIVLFNAAAEQVFGYPSEMILGEPLDLLVPERYRGVHRAHIHRFGATGATNRAMGRLHTLYGLRRDGREFPMEASISQVRTAEGVLYSVILRDVTERVRIEEQMERRMRRLSALRTIDLAISSSLDLRVTINIILDQVTAELGMDAADILLFDPLSQGLKFAAGRGFISNALEHTDILLGAGAAGTAAFEQRTLQVPDLDQVSPELLRADLFKADGFRAFFVTPLLAKGEIKGVLEVFHRTPYTPDAEWVSFFEALAGQAAIAIDSAQLFDNLQRSNQQLLLAYNATIEGWSHALDLRDHETEGHTQRVTEMTMRLAHASGYPFSAEDYLHMRRGALLHDIGKMGVPDSILLKPDDLTEDEQAIMRRHPEYAYQLLAPIVYLRKALDIPYCHHEYWDGSGYPRGLKGEQIPLAARIFSVIDVWDALRSDRPYRPGWPDEQVHAYLRAHAGREFDPQIVEVFLRMLAEEK